MKLFTVRIKTGSGTGYNYNVAAMNITVAIGKAEEEHSKAQYIGPHMVESITDEGKLLQ